MTSPIEAEPGTDGGTAADTVDEVAPRVAVATRRGLAAWVGLLALCFVLDGLPGTTAALVVGVVVLARLPRRWIGRVGVAALVAVPMVVVAGGVPTEAQVSPAFVSRSMWPHHLAFVGLALASTAAVLELLPSLRGLRRAGVVHADDADPAHRVPAPALPDVARYAVVAVVAVGLLASCVAVLQA